MGRGLVEWAGGGNRPCSLSLRLRRFRHGLGDTAQDVDFLGGGLRAVEKLVEPRHEFLGRGRVEEADVHQRALPVREHAGHLGGVGGRGRGCGVPHGKAAECEPPFVGDHLDGRTQVERAEAGVGGNGERDMAAVHVLVRHAEALGAEQEGDTRLPCRSRRCGGGIGVRGWHGGHAPFQGQFGQGMARIGGLPAHQPFEMLARRAGGRAEIAWRHRGGAQVADAVQGFVQRGDDTGVLQHVERSARALDGLFAPQHVGPARGHQDQIPEAHGLHGAGGGADVAGMAGLDEDEAGFHGKRHSGKDARLSPLRPSYPAPGPAGLPSRQCRPTDLPVSRPDIPRSCGLSDCGTERRADR